jgi:acetyl coenzyme A synthetase (ADP forming)-like protein
MATQSIENSETLVLRDGSTASIRRATPSDAQLLYAFFAQLSEESRRRRFFTPAIPSMELVTRLCENSDPRAELTLLVWRYGPDGPRIIATGSYHAKSADVAEVAFAVDDRWQGLGLGTLLLEALAWEAVRQGFNRLWAVTHADNQSMRNVFRDSGFAIVETPSGNEIEVDLSLAPSQRSDDRMGMRHRAATVASLRPFFKPRSIAVVGASRRAGNIGRRVLERLIEGGFTGEIYPINPQADEIAGRKCYSRVSAVPGSIDLAVIAVPAEQVGAVVDDCATKGVRALVVISAGFAEVGEEGQRLQQQLMDKVRGYGMRLIGPNCLGVLTTDPEIRMNASFSPIFPEPGRVAVSSDSGALGLAVVARTARGNLGVSSCVSVGNRADVSSNDLLEYWEVDENTDAIVLYMESFGNPRRFARIARRVSRSKPIVVVKAGRTKAGTRAASSHTAALAASDTVIDGLFRQVGVIRTPTLADVLYVAEALAGQPLPRGKKVGILTNAGGPAILATDACESVGLEVPAFSSHLQAELRKLAHPHASVANPVDLVASAIPADYRRAITTLMQSGEINALIAIHVNLEPTGNEAYQQAVRDGVADCSGAGACIPVYAVFLPDMPTRSLVVHERSRIPCYPFPESAARVLGYIAQYADWRAQPVGSVPQWSDADPSQARSVCRRVLADRGAGWLSAVEAQCVLQAMGLPLVRGEVAQSLEEASQIADRIGFPVAVKLVSRTLTHKTEVGGVRLNLSSVDEVRQAFDEIRSSLEEAGHEDQMEGVLVQKMIPQGIEVVVGVTLDPLFGPVLAFGMGGVMVELWKDVSFRVVPLTDRDAWEMIHSIRAARRFQGFRGQPPGDVSALQDVLLRVSRLAEEVIEISELDLNPVFVLPPGQGCALVDARIRVQPVE